MKVQWYNKGKIETISYKWMDLSKYNVRIRIRKRNKLMKATILTLQQNAYTTIHVP